MLTGKKEQQFSFFSTWQLMWELPAVSAAISQKLRDYRAWEQGGEFILQTWRHLSEALLNEVFSHSVVSLESKRQLVNSKEEKHFNCNNITIVIKDKHLSTSIILILREHTSITIPIKLTVQITRIVLFLTIIDWWNRKSAYTLKCAYSTWMFDPCCAECVVFDKWKW